MLSLVKGKPTLPPIELGTTGMKYDPVYSRTIITVPFKNVKGRLLADGRPSGFEITDHNSSTPYFFGAEVLGDKVLLYSHIPPMLLSGLSLHYGYGNNPHCNIHDESDRSLPAFGPVPLIGNQALTAHIRHWEVTRLLPGVGKLHDFHYPENLDSLPWRPMAFPTCICRMHEEFQTEKGKDRLVFFRCRICVPKKMKLQFLLGYDGPIKLWIDGRELLHDPDGTPPFTSERKKIAWNPSVGISEILIAFGSACGDSWGISLRMERLGTSASEVKKSPDELPRLAD